MEKLAEYQFDASAPGPGVLSLGKDILVGLPKSVRQGVALGLRDYKSEYKGNLLGQLWAILSPLVYTVAFMIFKAGDGDFVVNRHSIPQGLFLIIGFSFFQLWMDTLVSQADALRKNKSLVSKLGVKLEVLFFGNLTKSIIDGIVRSGLILAVIVYFGSSFYFSWFLYPFTLFAVIFTALGLGVFLAPVAALYKDVVNTIRSVSLGVLFLSPILYPANQDPSSWGYTLTWINPLGSTISTARDCLIGGDFFWASGLIYWVLISFLLIVVQFVNMRLILPILIERLGN